MEVVASHEFPLLLTLFSSLYRALLQLLLLLLLLLGVPTVAASRCRPKQAGR
jgi:hypothetical protein